METCPWFGCCQLFKPHPPAVGEKLVRVLVKYAFFSLPASSVLGKHIKRFWYIKKSNEQRRKWLKNTEGNGMKESVIQTAIMIHHAVAELILLFCPDCHVQSCILLLISSKEAIFWLLTYIRNYGRSLFFSFKKTLQKSLKSVLCIYNVKAFQFSQRYD